MYLLQHGLPVSLKELSPLRKRAVHRSLDAAVWLQVLLNIGKCLHTCTVKRHIIALHPIHISLTYIQHIPFIRISLTYIQYIPFIYPLHTYSTSHSYIPYIHTAHPIHKSLTYIQYIPFIMYNTWTCDMSRAISHMWTFFRAVQFHALYLSPVSLCIFL